MTRIHLAVLAIIVATAACTPANQIIPLRGEDPNALQVSSERAQVLAQTGATRALDDLRAALQRKDWDSVAARLGPATHAILRRAAAEAGTDEGRVLRAGHVSGLSLPGAQDPLSVLESPGKATVAEDVTVFDPARRAVHLMVRIEGQPEVIEVPATYSETGWCIELVRLLDVEPAEK